MERSPAIVQQSLYHWSMSGVAVVDLEVLARVGLALSDRSRREIMARMLDGPAYPAELADELGMTRANVSNHLACLRGCGLVVATPEGRRVRYEISHPSLRTALRQLGSLDLAVLDEACGR